jgi:hypothetical protein
MILTLATAGAFAVLGGTVGWFVEKKLEKTSEDPRGEQEQGQTSPRLSRAMAQTVTSTIQAPPRQTQHAPPAISARGYPKLPSPQAGTPVLQRLMKRLHYFIKVTHAPVNEEDVRMKELQTDVLALWQTLTDAFVELEGWRVVFAEYSDEVTLKETDQTTFDALVQHIDATIQALKAKANDYAIITESSATGDEYVSHLTRILKEFASIEAWITTKLSIKLDRVFVNSKVPSTVVGSPQ